MKEILIHKNSRLFLSDKDEDFIYVAKSTEILLFGCSGIYFNQSQLQCNEDDLFILEEHQIYTFQMPANGTLLITTLSFSPQQAPYQFYHSIFQHEEIKALCIVLAKQMQYRDEKSELLFNSYMNKLGFLILNHYTYQGDKPEISKVQFQDERIHQIHEIVHTHYHEELTLIHLADKLHLTPQYVSQFFKNNFGCTFLHYLALTRLHSAMGDIQETSKPFLDIAMNHGFANVRAFQTIFQETFSISPKQYRKLLVQRTFPHTLKRADITYMNFMEKELQTLPKGYVQEKQENIYLTLQANAQGKPLKHTWQNLMTVGRARLLVLDDIRKQLSTIQKDIGFKMIRFHGIFNDDMHVYEEDENGDAIYNFHQVNDALDFILKVGLKPFVELGFMPAQLAKDPKQLILNGIFLVSPPKDMKKWQNLVIAFLKNCINRYGFDEVVSWYFEFWNNGGITYDETETNEQLKRRFWQGTLHEYLDFYKATYAALKSVHPSLRIGGPSVGIKNSDFFKRNMEEFIQFIHKNNCNLDFITLHIYPHLTMLENDQYTVELPLFKDSLKTLKKLMKDYKFKSELHITEWSTWGLQSQINFNDGCEKALYLLRSMVDSLDQVDSLGYWTFSDYTETMKTKQRHIFSDNAGLITSNGIKKAAYHAYTLLHKLGDVQLDKGENYLFTRRNKHFQLLLFCDKQQEREESNICFHMTLQHIPNGMYEKKIYFLNKKSGSAYDVWKEMGMHREIMGEDVEYLKAHSMMSYVRETVQIKQNQDYEMRYLKINEAILIEWIYKY